jgi:hypothetical protein
LRVSENRVLRRIFGPKREEVAGGWRRLHNEELHNLYASLNIVRVIYHAARFCHILHSHAHCFFFFGGGGWFWLYVYFFLGFN